MVGFKENKMGLLKKLFGDYSEKEIKRIIPLQQQVLELESKYAAFSDDELKGMTDKLKEELENGKTLDDIIFYFSVKQANQSRNILNDKSSWFDFLYQAYVAQIKLVSRVVEISRTGKRKALTRGTTNNYIDIRNAEFFLYFKWIKGCQISTQCSCVLSIIGIGR